jgi:hypothetical protein
VDHVLARLPFLWSTLAAPDAYRLDLIEIATRLAGVAIERQLKEERLNLCAEIISRSTEAIRISDHNDRVAEQNAAHRQMFGLTDLRTQRKDLGSDFRRGTICESSCSLKEDGQINGELIVMYKGSLVS